MSNHLDSFGAQLNQSQFFRIFALGCFDSFITLPITITRMVINIVRTVPQFTFYPGWTSIHSNWEPGLLPKSKWSISKLGVFEINWDEWVNPFYAMVFFGLFGLTADARKGYRRFFYFIRRPFCVRQAESVQDSLPEMFENGGEASITVMSNFTSR